MKSETIKMIPCGTHIETVLGKTKAIITGISIRFDKPSYEVSYFNNGAYVSVWLNESEFTRSNESGNTLGFNVMAY